MKLTQIHKIGNVYNLKESILNNKINTLGCCYELYNIGHPGISVIFANGNYDGFNYDEIDEFLNYEYFSDKHGNYPFTNVMQLTRHFNNGFWDDIFYTPRKVITND